MQKKPPDLFSFWNELKRRKVIKAVFVYVAVAWAILEASDTIFLKLGLPDWTVTFVLILLIIVFNLVIGPVPSTRYPAPPCHFSSAFDNLSAF